MNNLTLIIPAKNETESLPRVISELEKFNFNINVVLHESDSDTIKSIEKLNVKIVCQKNLGYGDALIEGIKKCNTKYFCIFNADGSFIPEEIKEMHQSLEKNNLDFVFGSRYQPNSGSDDDTIITLIGNHFFTFLGNFLFKLNITDILYTFVFGKTELAKKLNLSQKDFTICVELPIKAKKNDMKLGSINCYERKRIAGKKKVKAFKDGFLILVHMVKLYFK
tara:strand:+ start:5105 stop:5770 length:666 start_codon:yes stop_codon:yes gene_type:complete